MTSHAVLSSNFLSIAKDADIDLQKMILARLIERIAVGKGYDIGIKFSSAKTLSSRQ